MAAERANDLHAFKSFIDEQLTSGEAVPTVDEVLRDGSTRTRAMRSGRRPSQRFAGASPMSKRGD